MKKNSKIAAGLQPQYIVDQAGKRTAVILDIKTFERLVDHIEGLYMGFFPAEKTSKQESDYAEMEEVNREIDSFSSPEL